MTVVEELTHGGVTILCTKCLSFLWYLHLVLGVILLRHSWNIYGESFGFPGGAASLRPNILWSMPLHPKIYHRVHIGGIPIHAGDCVQASQDV